MVGLPQEYERCQEMSPHSIEQRWGVCDPPIFPDLAEGQLESHSFPIPCIDKYLPHFKKYCIWGWHFTVDLQSALCVALCFCLLYFIALSRICILYILHFTGLV